MPPDLLPQGLLRTLDRFLERRDRHGVVEVWMDPKPGQPEWSPFPFPGDYGEPAAFLGQQVAALDPAPRRACVDRLYDAAREVWAADPKFGYAVGLVLSMVPEAPSNRAKAIQFLSETILAGKHRQTPSGENDLHRMAVAILGRPELAGRGREDALRADVVRVLTRDVTDPAYAAAALRALATHLKEAATPYLVPFLAAAHAGGYPPDFSLFQFAEALGAESTGWAEVGKTLRGRAAAKYLVTMLQRMSWGGARSRLLSGLRPTRSRVTEYTDAIHVPVVSRTGAEVGSITVDPKDFGGKISKQLMHDAVLMHLANQRAGTHSTLRRGEVAGSTKKLFRQKGTGNARAGTKRTNKRRGGGTAKGPKPRDYYYRLPKKAVKAANRMAVLSKIVDKEIVVIDDFALAAPKTKEVFGLLKNLKVGKKATEGGEKDMTLADTTVLIGTNGIDQNVYRSARNIAGVKVLPVAEFNCYTVLRQKRLLVTRAALEAIIKPPAAPAGAAAPADQPVKRRGRALRIAQRKAAEREALA